MAPQDPQEDATSNTSKSRLSEDKSHQNVENVEVAVWEWIRKKSLICPTMGTCIFRCNNSCS